MGIILGPIAESTLKNPTSLVPVSQSVAPSSLPVTHCTPAIFALSVPTPSSLIPISVVLTFTITRSKLYHPFCWPHDHCHQNLLQQLSSTPVPRSPALSHPALSGMTGLRQDGPCFSAPTRGLAFIALSPAHQPRNHVAVEITCVVPARVPHTLNGLPCGKGHHWLFLSAYLVCTSDLVTS